MMHLLEQRVIHDYAFFKKIILIFHGKRKKKNKSLRVRSTQVIQQKINKNESNEYHRDAEGRL